MYKKIYLEILDKIRSNLREGDFSKLEIPLNYSRPILILLQKAIKKYGFKKEILEDIKIPTGNNYTLLKGTKGASFIHEDSYNEEILLEKEIEELSKRVDFENIFKSDLTSFSNFKEKKKKENLRMQYFNDKVDRLVNNVLDYISSEKLIELYHEVSKLEDNLEHVKHKCGSTTEKIVKKIKLAIKDNLSKEKIKVWNTELENSFTKLDVQKKLISKKESLFALGFIEE